MVGADGPTKLATIVQLMPIYVNFNIDEQQVLDIRERMRIAGVTLKDLGPIPVDIALQNEQGYPHTGTLDYVAPEVDSQHRHPRRARGARKQRRRAAAGPFVRVRIPKQKDVESLSCRTSPSATTSRAATC